MRAGLPAADASWRTTQAAWRARYLSRQRHGRRGGAARGGCLVGLPAARAQFCEHDYIAWPREQCTLPCPVEMKCSYNSVRTVKRYAADYCCLCNGDGQGRYWASMCPGSARPPPAARQVPPRHALPGLPRPARPAARVRTSAVADRLTNAAGPGCRCPTTQQSTSSSGQSWSVCRQEMPCRRRTCTCPMPSCATGRTP